MAAVAAATAGRIRPGRRRGRIVSTAIIWPRSIAGGAALARPWGPISPAQGLSPGQIEELQAACQAQRRHLQSVARPLTGVRATLRELYQAGITLAVICNCEHSGDALRQWLDRFAMGECFRAVISSIDLGQAMPDPASYRAALLAMKLPPQRVAFVGHDAAELAGAAALGMSTIAFNSDADARAELAVDRFEDLLHLSATPLAYAA